MISSSAECPWEAACKDFSFISWRSQEAAWYIYFYLKQLTKAKIRNTHINLLSSKSIIPFPSSAFTQHPQYYCDKNTPSFFMLTYPERKPTLIFPLTIKQNVDIWNIHDRWPPEAEICSARKWNVPILAKGDPPQGIQLIPSSHPLESDHKMPNYCRFLKLVLDTSYEHYPFLCNG